MKFIKQITILFFILSIGSLGAQVKFEAKVSKTKLGVNERLRLDFEMNQDGDNFTPPDFSGFTVVGGPNQAVSHSWVNGKRSFNKTYSYFLAPKGRGTFTIGQATIIIEGQTYKTVPVKVEVTAAIEKPENPDDPSYIASENVHLVAEISKANPYLNEAIRVVYKLYVSPTVAVDNWNELDSPRFNDFWSQNINTQDQKVQNGTYKGEDYRFLVLRETVLYPQKTGKLNIEPLTLDIAIRVPTKRRDIFGQPFMARTNKRVSAGNKTIDVKPLPEAGKPADFSGAVGNFTFNVSTTKKSLNASESFQLKLSVQGNGNLKLFKLPKVALPSSLEVYEPEHTENVKTNAGGMFGSISDSYTVVPQYKGKYPVPSISFSYFDLKTESYKRLSSNEIVIDVLEGPANNPTTSPVVSKQTVTTTGNSFAYIKTNTVFSSISTVSFFKTKLFWSLLLTPFLAIPLAIVVRRKIRARDADLDGIKVRKADKLAKKYLGAAKKSLGKKETFYIALEKALHNYLKAKLQIETSDLSKEKINVLLLEKQVEPQVVNNFLSLIEQCELARYTPIDVVTMQEDYEKSAKTISLIDKQAR